MAKKTRKLAVKTKKTTVKHVTVADFRELLPSLVRAHVAVISDDELLKMPYTKLSISIAHLGRIYEDLLKKRGIRHRSGCMNEEEFHRGESASRRWAESFARLSEDKTVAAIIRSVNCI